MVLLFQQVGKGRLSGSRRRGALLGGRHVAQKAQISTKRPKTMKLIRLASICPGLRSL